MIQVTEELDDGWLVLPAPFSATSIVVSQFWYSSLSFFHSSELHDQNGTGTMWQWMWSMESYLCRGGYAAMKLHVIFMLRCVIKILAVSDDLSF